MTPKQHLDTEQVEARASAIQEQFVTLCAVCRLRVLACVMVRELSSYDSDLRGQAVAAMWETLRRIPT